MLDYFPRIRPTLSVVTHRWGWPILISDECESPITITMGDVPDKDGEEPGANVVSQNGGAVLVGGSTVLTLSRYRAERLDVVDFSEFDCDSERKLLSTVLAHEIGHILGVPHRPEGLMADRALPCRDLFPSADDIRESSRPG